jgi:hypothetical protein
MPLSSQEDSLSKDQLSLPFQYEEHGEGCQPHSCAALARRAATVDKRL